MFFYSGDTVSLMKKMFLILLILILIASNVYADFMLPRQYNTSIPLTTGDTTSCAIIYPAEKPGFRLLAERIVKELSSLGVTKVPIFKDTQAVPQRLGKLRMYLQEKYLILLGDLNTNRAIFPLYANYYTYCDAKYPGGDGYVLQTVVRPFGRKVNYLIIGGSTYEGVAEGVQRFLTKLKSMKPDGDIEFPYCLEVKPESEIKEILDPFLAAGHQSDDFIPPASKENYGYALDQFTKNAHLYFYTGKEVFAQKARNWILYLADYDDQAIRIGDYTMENLAAAWRRVSPCDVFTSEQRQKIDNRLYETAVHHEQSWWRLKDASKGIGGRHHTTGMLAWWTLIRVLLELGQPDDAADRQLNQWRHESELYLNGLQRHYWDDLDDYQSADSVQNTASYCLQTNQLSWFHDGLGRRAAEKLLAITDNMGSYAGIQGYGESLPGWEFYTLNGGLLLGACGFVYQDGSFTDVLEHFPMLDKSWGALQPWGLHQFDAGDRLDPQQPSWLEGLNVIRFSPYRWDLINRGDFLKTELMDGFHVTGLTAHGNTEQRAFDKLVYRGGLSIDSQYLLLQGMSAIALSTIDMNSIVRHTDQGKIWLLHNTAQRSLFFKNGIYISNGINEQAIPATCELVSHADFGKVALACSRLPDYRGTRWTRNLIISKNQFIAVIDQIHAQKRGKYVLCCTWRTPGFASLTKSRWESVQDDITFVVSPGEQTGLFSSRLPQRDGATRPTVLRENRVFSAKSNDDFFFENLLHTYGPDRKQDYKIRRLAPGVILMQQHIADKTTIWLAAACEEGIEIEGLKTNANVILLGPEGAWVTGGTEFRLENSKFDISSGYFSPNEEFTKKVNHYLNTLWNKKRLPQTTTSPMTPATLNSHLRPMWTHSVTSSQEALLDGIRFRAVRNVDGPAILATDRIIPALQAEPRLSPQRGSGFSLHLSSKMSKVEKKTGRSSHTLPEITLSPLKNAEFVLELPRQVKIDEITLFGNTLGETNSPLPPARLDFEVSFSNDGFHHDIRTCNVSIQRDVSYHNLYKGHSYVFERYRAGNFNEDATAVRIRIMDGTSGNMILNDIQLRSPSLSSHQPIEVLVADLDGDKNEEIIAWTKDGGLAVLRADGVECWSQQWPSGIIAVDTWDLEYDGKREVFVSRTDRSVEVLDIDGAVRWEKDCGGLYDQMDQRFYGDGSIIYGMAAWQPDGLTKKEILLTSYFCTARFDTKGNLKECFKRSGHFTQIRSISEGFEDEGGLVIRSDIPWVGPVPLEWWSIDTGNPHATCSVPNGQTVFFEVDDYDRDKKVEALIATTQGIGLYAAEEPMIRWQHMTEAPPTGVGIIKDRVKGATIAYGRQDGYLFVLDVHGKLLRKVLLDEPIQCLTAVRTAQGDDVILAGTLSALHCFRLKDLSTVWRLAGSYQQLKLLHHAGRDRVLAIAENGQIQRFDL